MEVGNLLHAHDDPTGLHGWADRAEDFHFRTEICVQVHIRALEQDEAPSGEGEPMRALHGGSDPCVFKNSLVRDVLGLADRRARCFLHCRRRFWLLLVVIERLGWSPRACSEEHHGVEECRRGCGATQGNLWRGASIPIGRTFTRGFACFRMQRASSPFFFHGWIYCASRWCCRRLHIL